MTTAYDPCGRCEELMQPYLDRVLDEAERAEAERHLDLCGFCRKRYRFEESLRKFVRDAVVEPIPVELETKLADLRASV